MFGKINLVAAALAVVVMGAPVFAGGVQDQTMCKTSGKGCNIQQQVSAPSPKGQVQTQVSKQGFKGQTQVGTQGFKGQTQVGTQGFKGQTQVGTGKYQQGRGQVQVGRQQGKRQGMTFAQ